MRRTYMLQDQNVVACVSTAALPGSQEYASKDAQLVHAWNIRMLIALMQLRLFSFSRLITCLALSLVFIIAEFVGFFSGLSMFSSLTSLFCILISYSKIVNC